ncbi:hypothetical protein ACLKA6_014546 [Drosophila palustris]
MNSVLTVTLRNFNFDLEFNSDHDSDSVDVCRSSCLCGLFEGQHAHIDHKAGHTTTNWGEAKEKLQQQEAWHLYCSDVYKLVAFSLRKVVEFQEFPEFVDVNVNLKLGLGEQRTEDRRQTMIQPRAGIISP